MKVLHVIPSFAPAWRYGGPIVAALGLTRELARQGHDVTVMTTNIDGPGVLDVPLDRPVSMDGVNVWYFPIQRPRWYYYSRPLARALRQQVEGFDIVHIHSIYLWPTTVASFWCRRHGVPYLVRLAGSLDPASLTKSYEGRRASIASKAKKRLYLNTLGRWDLGRANGLHFTSKAEMESSLALKLRPPGYVLPLGVDLPEAGRGVGGLRLRQDYPELRGKKIVLFLSRLDPKKGLDVLVPAMARLASRRDDFALVVAGGGTTAYESKVASLISEHGLDDRTVFLGMVEGSDKWSVLSEADVYILPSYIENFGISVVEAMAAGLPVVISDQVNIHQEVSAGGAGLVTSLDPEDVANAMDRLLTDEALRATMGDAGRALARELYSWERAARNIAHEYKNIISGGRHAHLDTMPSSMK
jgi:glycosyltransferase involved in cell wall biosynthesis